MTQLDLSGNQLRCEEVEELVSAIKGLSSLQDLVSGDWPLFFFFPLARLSLLSPLSLLFLSCLPQPTMAEPLAE